MLVPLPLELTNARVAILVRPILHLRASVNFYFYRRLSVHGPIPFISYLNCLRVNTFKLYPHSMLRATHGTRVSFDRTLARRTQLSVRSVNER